MRKLQADYNSVETEEEDFESLLMSHQGRLYGFIRTLLGGEGDADDLLQSTNQVIWQKAQSFELGSNFRAWAFQIARYQVMQFRDRQRKQGERIVFSDELIEALSQSANERDASYVRRRKFLQVCLTKMPERQRLVIEQRYFSVKGVAEIANDQGMSANAVSQLLFRGRENLLRCIEGNMLKNHELHLEES